MDDMRLLGFDVSAPSRTSHPMHLGRFETMHQLALSDYGYQDSINSRAHLIHKYTYPTSAIERAPAQLAELHVQKGHDPHLCHRVLQKIGAAALHTHLSPSLPSFLAPSLIILFTFSPKPLPLNLASADYGLVCVCVSTPVSKVVAYSNSLSVDRRSRAGGQRPVFLRCTTKLQKTGGSTQGRLNVYLLNFCPSRDSTFPFLFHGPCTIPPQTIPSRLQRLVCHPVETQC